MEKQAPQGLEYARPSLRGIDRRWRRWALVGVALIALAAVVWLVSTGSSRSSGPAISDGDFMIDCNVPGTEVWLEGRRLGVVPLKMMKYQLAALDVPASAPAPGGSQSPLALDGWKEGLFLGEEGERESKLMFRVPDAVAAKYLAIETRWGPRTKVSSGQFGANGVRATMAAATGADGLAVSLGPLPAVKRGDATAPVKVTVANTGGSTLSGHRPQLTVHWGTFHTPWRRRTRKEVSLPADWSSFGPGQTRSFSVDIPVPTVAEDYSVFVTFHLFQSPEGNVGTSGGYSESRLLRVR